MRFCFFIILLLFLIKSNTYAQEKNDFLYSFDFSYIYYNLNSSNYSVEYQNNFNYEINTRLFYNISNYFSIGFGLGYQNKDYYFFYNQPNTSGGLKREFYEKNLNFFFPVSYRRIKIKNIGLNINSALIINYVLKYEVKNSYTDGSNRIYSDIDFGKRDGLTYRFSIDFVKPINKKTSIFITPFLNYKFQFEELSYWDEKRFDLNDSNISLGFSIGVLFL